MVHAASLQAGEDNDRIKGLLEKAEYIYTQLSQFKDNLKNADNSDRLTELISWPANYLFYRLRTRDIDSLKRDIKDAEDQYSALSSDIEPLQKQAEQFNKQATEAQQRASSSDQVFNLFLWVCCMLIQPLI